MKILLVAVNSKYIHTNPALISLKSYALFYDPSLTEVIQIDEYTINNRMEEILSGIYKQKPDVLCFSVYIWNVSTVCSVIRELKKILPDIPIYLGGPEVSYKSLDVLSEYPEVKGVLIGEGEETFLELAKAYTNCKSEKDLQSVLSTIKGLHYRNGDDLCFTGERELTNLDGIPFLYEDLTQFEHKIIYYETSRGCPFRCSYCLSSIDKKVRLRDLSLVKKELQFFLDEKVPQVKFIDRTFNCNHEHAYEIWNYIREHDNGITNFHFEIGADLLNEKELELLNTLRPGAVQMEIGVQTTNEKTLHEICRVMDIEKLKAIVDRLHKGKNIHIHLDLIAGLPYEDFNSFRQSFNDVYGMKPEQLQLGFLKVLSGSYMKEKSEEYEIRYTTYPPYEVLCTKWISYEEICLLKQVEEMVELYYNSNQFVYSVSYLERFFDTPFDLYMALAAFYEEKAYFINTPSRAYRYDVLLEFVREKIIDKNITMKHELAYANEELMAELLTMDIYLRENAKSRPLFARDMNSYKEAINAFYRDEESKRADGTHLLKNYEDCDPRTMVRMLHIEPFWYDIFGENRTYQKLGKESFVLFDYKDRNALTYDAKTYILSGL